MTRTFSKTDVRRANSTAKKRGTDKTTKERLLEVAAAQFAEHGFRNTRTQDICKKANANIAAVNYHFGGKKGLYKVVWDYAVEHAIGETDSLDLSVDEDREWLYNYLRVCVLSVFESGPRSLRRRLISNEITDPSPISAEVLSEHLAPRIQDLEKRLRRMMGPYVTDFQIGCCILAIHSQFSALTVNRSARQNLFRNDKPTEEEAEHFTREICAFVIGGIRAIKGVPPDARRQRKQAKGATEDDGK